MPTVKAMISGMKLGVNAFDDEFTELTIKVFRESTVENSKQYEMIKALALGRVTITITEKW